MAELEKFWSPIARIENFNLQVLACQSCCGNASLKQRGRKMPAFKLALAIAGTKVVCLDHHKLATGRIGYCAEGSGRFAFHVSADHDRPISVRCRRGGS